MVSDGGSAFVYYNGSISGRFRWAKEVQPTCPDPDGYYYFGAIPDVYLRAGVNPSWDPNPFFFEFGGYAHETAPWANSTLTCLLGYTCNFDAVQPYVGS